MVKFFTESDESLAYEVGQEKKVFTPAVFEQELKARVQQLSKKPAEKTIANILDYSLSIRKLD